MMTEFLNTPMLLLTYFGWLLGGIALGVIYFVLVRHGAALIVNGGGVGKVILLLAIRLCIIGVGLFAASQHGTWPLLAEAAGVLIGRQIVLRRQSGPAS